MAEIPPDILRRILQHLRDGAQSSELEIDLDTAHFLHVCRLWREAAFGDRLTCWFDCFRVSVPSRASPPAIRLVAAKLQCARGHALEVYVEDLNSLRDTVGYVCCSPRRSALKLSFTRSELVRVLAEAASRIVRLHIGWSGDASTTEKIYRLLRRSWPRLGDLSLAPTQPQAHPPPLDLRDGVNLPVLLKLRLHHLPLPLPGSPLVGRVGELSWTHTPTHVAPFPAEIFDIFPSLYELELCQTLPPGALDGRTVERLGELHAFWGNPALLFALRGPPHDAHCVVTYSSTAAAAGVAGEPQFDVLIDLAVEFLLRSQLWNNKNTIAFRLESDLTMDDQPRHKVEFIADQGLGQACIIGPPRLLTSRALWDGIAKKRGGGFTLSQTVTFDDRTFSMSWLALPHGFDAECIIICISRRLPYVPFFYKRYMPSLATVWLTCDDDHRRHADPVLDPDAVMGFITDMVHLGKDGIKPTLRLSEIHCGRSMDSMDGFLTLFDDVLIRGSLAQPTLWWSVATREFVCLPDE